MPFVGQGGSVSPDIFIRTASDELTDPDTATLTLAVKDPDGHVIAGFPITYRATGFVRLSLGHFAYTWHTASDQAQGTYIFEWDCQLNAAAVPTKNEEVEVLPAGSIDTQSGVLMTVDELWSFNVAKELPSANAQVLLDATATEINAFLGPNDLVTEERLPGEASIVMLSRQATAIRDVTEHRHHWSESLSSNDYQLTATGLSIRRLLDGDHPRHDWEPEVDVTYTPVDTLARRKTGQLALITLEINRNPGLLLERIGDWEARYLAIAGSADIERQAILDGLRDTSMVFFG